MKEFSHLDPEGRARMVDVSGKDITLREAVVKGLVKMKKETLELIKEKKVKKGDVFSTARIAGIIGAKKTHELIPLCHPLKITNIQIDFEFPNDREIEITAIVKGRDRTGVEMEAFVGAATAALTIYDMCKAVDREIEIDRIRLIKKEGGKSGKYSREE